MSQGRRQKLLVLASTYPRWRGDPEPGFVHELSRRLSERFEVMVVCPHARGAMLREMFDGVDVRRFRYAPERFETLINDGGMIGNLRRSPWKVILLPGFLVALAVAVLRAVSTDKPAVSHAHWLVPQGLVLAALAMFTKRVPPFLVTSHGADLFALQSIPMTALKRFVVGRAAALTVVSTAMVGELGGISARTGPVSVQPMGVDLMDRFTPGTTQTRSSDEILFVGRMVEKKGLAHLIDAMPAILRARPSAFLTIVGFGPEEASRREQVARLCLGEKVRFVGAVTQDELPALYRRAAVFVAPFVRARSGDQEGLGLVLVEAIGCACPVVVGNVPAVHELLAGETSNVVDATDLPSLAGAVGRVLSDPAMAARGAAALRSRIAHRFDWEHVARRYAELLQAVADRRIA